MNSHQYVQQAPESVARTQTVRERGTRGSQSVGAEANSFSGPTNQSLQYLLRSRLDCAEKCDHPKSKTDNPGADRSNTEAPPYVEQKLATLRGGGDPLPHPIRSYFEPRLGHDFSRVRLHKGLESDRLNSELDARAFTVGRDIFLRNQEYAPGVSSGRHLLAHELVHVLQQQPGGYELGGLKTSRPDNLRIARAGPCGRSTAPGHTAGVLETQFKYQGYRFWRSRFIRAPHWRTLADAWFFEVGPNPVILSGLSDNRNKDIVLNTGFQLLYNLWAMGFRGNISKSRVRNNSLQWRYEYNPSGAAGGGPAYTSAAHFLGTYTANITSGGSSGGRSLKNISIYNCSGWVSGTRLPPVIGGPIGVTSLYENHPRGAGPTTPSVGGDMEQNYNFTVPGPTPGTPPGTPFNLRSELIRTGHIAPGERSSE